MSLFMLCVAMRFGHHRYCRRCHTVDATSFDFLKLHLVEVQWQCERGTCGGSRTDSISDSSAFKNFQITFWSSPTKWTRGGPSGRAAYLFTSKPLPDHLLSAWNCYKPPCGLVCLSDSDSNIHARTYTHTLPLQHRLHTGMVALFHLSLPAPSCQTFLVF